MIIAKRGLFTILVFYLILCSSQSQAQLFSKKGSHKHYRKSRTSSPMAKRQCAMLRKKKNHKPKKVRHFASSKKVKSTPLAEYDPNDLAPRTPKTKPEPKPKKETQPVAESTHDKSFEEMDLDEKHAVEDEVLAKNNLPAPTSKKHEEIRKNVENHLKGHKKGEPIKLAPLYFTFDEDEFSVVDMEPFLVAVEYALQGYMVLIEGHTDSHGEDNYNLKLSIKRVEKIRQLMHDMGVPDERISIVGYGEEISTHDNTSEEGREKNRRVDFTVF